MQLGMVDTGHWAVGIFSILMYYLYINFFSNMLSTEMSSSGSYLEVHIYYLSSRSQNAKWLGDLVNIKTSLKVFDVIVSIDQREIDYLAIV